MTDILYLFVALGFVLLRQSRDSSTLKASGARPSRSSGLDERAFLSQIDPTMFILRTCRSASNTFGYELGRRQMRRKRSTNNYTAL